MKHEFLDKSGNDRLILLFLGWGMDAEPFRKLRKQGYDLMAVWDYREPDFPESEVTDYHEIVVLAWSFGVRIATEFIRENDGLPITRTIAVNGTPLHIDNDCGIPEAIFNGTLRGLSDQTLRKFNRRMFADKAAFDLFMEDKPKRSIEDLTEELERFGELKSIEPGEIWDRAVVGGRDAIFPPDNQMKCWSGGYDYFGDMPHFPDFAKLLERYVVDKDLVAERFGRSRNSYGDNASVQRKAAEKLWELARKFVKTDGDTLEIGVGDGTLTSVYMKEMSPSTLTLWDIAETDAAVMPAGSRFECCDAECAVASLPRESLDLIISSSTLQWFNSPAVFLERCLPALRPAGVIAVSFYQAGTFSEVAEATGVTLQYPTVESVLSSVKKVYEVLLVEMESCVERFPSAKDAIRNLKLTGVNAVSRDRSAAFGLIRNYPVEPDGSATLTYKPIYLVLRRKE